MIEKYNELIQIIREKYLQAEKDFLATEENSPEFDRAFSVYEKIATIYFETIAQRNIVRDLDCIKKIYKENQRKA